MTLFSAFRTPVAADAFERVFRALPDTGDRKDAPLQATLAALDDATFDSLVARLVGYRLLRYNKAASALASRWCSSATWRPATSNFCPPISLKKRCSGRWTKERQVPEVALRSCHAA